MQNHEYVSSCASLRGGGLTRYRVPVIWNLFPRRTSARVYKDKHWLVQRFQEQVDFSSCCALEGRQSRQRMPHEVPCSPIILWNWEIRGEGRMFAGSCGGHGESTTARRKKRKSAKVHISQLQVLFSVPATTAVRNCEDSEQ